mmetsp:Transcript_51517/g.130182  ORF Transcript_51517/g.130182 Transcript_51517/m.130182 type:complete len:398 (-) Transcript_51517:51-1244(-)
MVPTFLKPRALSLVAQVTMFAVVADQSATVAIAAESHAAPAAARAPCLASSAACKTEEDLQAWYTNLRQQLEQAVPPPFREAPLNAAKNEFRKRLAELKSSLVGVPAVDGQVPVSPPLPPASLPVAMPPSRLEGEAGVEAAAAIPPKSAEDCRTEVELKWWRDHQLEQIQRTLPKEIQHVGVALLGQDFERRLEALRRGRGFGVAVQTPSSEVGLGSHSAVVAPPSGGVPSCLLSVKACQSERELRAWRATKLAWIRDVVPPSQQGDEVVAVRRDFERRRGELLQQQQNSQGRLQGARADSEELPGIKPAGIKLAEDEATPPPPPAVAAVVAATEMRAPMGDYEGRLTTLALCIAGLSMPAFFALVAAACRWVVPPAKEATRITELDNYIPVSDQDP